MVKDLEPILEIRFSSRMACPYIPDLSMVLLLFSCRIKSKRLPVQEIN